MKQERLLELAGVQINERIETEFEDLQLDLKAALNILRELEIGADNYAEELYMKNDEVGSLTRALKLFSRIEEKLRTLNIRAGNQKDRKWYG